MLWRAQEGYYFVDPTWGLSLPLLNIEGTGASTFTYGLGAFIQRQPGRWLQYIMPWYELKLEYFSPTSGGDLNLSSAIHFKGNGFYEINTQWLLRYGFVMRQYKFTPAAPKEDLQLGVDTGVLWKF